MIKRNSRVCWGLQEERRGTVVDINHTTAYVVGDDGITYTLPINMIEEIRIFIAHSAEYLRSLPRDMRPEID